MFAHRLRVHQRFDISWDNCETFLGVKNVSIVTGIMAEDEGFYHLSSATLDTRNYKTNEQECFLLFLFCPFYFFIVRINRLI